jgi:hypothetical protein
VQFTTASALPASSSSRASRRWVTVTPRRVSSASNQLRWVAMSTIGTASSKPSAYPAGRSPGGTRRSDGTASRHQGSGAGARKTSRPVRIRTPDGRSAAIVAGAAKPSAAQRVTAASGNAR